MLTREDAILLVQEALDALQKSAILEAKIHVINDTALFGVGSSIDSMGFVTLITDVEERLNALTKKDLFIVLSDLEDLYPEAPVLSASMFAEYLVRLVND
jgi:hypothetical protein